MAFASSGTGEEKIDKAGLKASEFDGLPAIEGAIATLACDLSQAVSAGTHTVFIAEIKELTYSEDGEALMYGLQGFGSFTRSQ